MNGFPSQQRGMTMISFLLMFMLIGFFTLLVLKLAPIYLEHFKIVNSLDALKAQSNLAEQSKDDILKSLEKRWDINSVDHVTKKDVEITRVNGQWRIRVAYEVAEPIMGNVEALVYFDDTIESGTR